MEMFRKAILLLVTFSFLMLTDCKTVDEDIGSMLPTGGFPFLTSKEEIKDYLNKKCVDTIKFKKGEIIADIGAGNGYIAAMLSFYHDSLTFYIQDIDTSYCNQANINEVVDFYQQVNSKPFTNKFIAVNGTDTTTNLPDSIFDKVLMMYTYQFLKEPLKIILDVRQKLKDDGLFYVINPQNDDYEFLNAQSQKYGWNCSPLEKEISDIIDCGFELIRISRYWGYEGFQNPYIMVFRKN